jgi:hypothetical protein
VRRRVAAALALAAAGLGTASVPAGAEQTTTQRFFAGRLMADERTSREVEDMLRSGRGFVDRRVVRDLTGDGRADAVVKVQTGGAAGAVALYVFSTDTGRRGSGLEAVFRSQQLLQAETRIRDGVLRYRSARPARGEEVCCASRVAETRLRWREARHRFTVAERREIGAAEPWGDQAP